MAKHNTGKGAGRRSAPPSRSNSPKKNFSGKPARKSASGKSYGNSSSNSFGSDRRKSPGSNRKFNSNRSENSDRSENFFDGGKPTNRGKKRFGSPDRAWRREKPDGDRGKKGSYEKKFDSKDSNDKRPFKKGLRTSPPTGLRRESSYNKSGNESPPQKRKSYSSFSERKATESFKKAERTKGKIRTDFEAPPQTEKIRLNKFIANSGVCSRREADELIKMGVISVNGKTITELGYKVNPGDEVRHESKVLRAEKPVYILLNKPKGFLTTTSDPQERNTVMHLIGNNVKERVYPVGRLDRNTTGLLLLTNDGDLADKLMHPSYNAKKIYKVELDRPLTKSDAQLIMDGVQLEEGRALVDDLAIVSDDKKTVGIEIHIGWNRVVRRIFEALNYQVIKLDRSVYAGLDKKDLGRGEWRFLTKEELVRLKHFK
jgi:23S rRNA pseudouridine2605 synthase